MAAGSRNTARRAIAAWAALHEGWRGTLEGSGKRWRCGNTAARGGAGEEAQRRDKSDKADRQKGCPRAGAGVAEERTEAVRGAALGEASRGRVRGSGLAVAFGEELQDRMRIGLCALRAGFRTGDGREGDGGNGHPYPRVFIPVCGHGRFRLLFSHKCGGRAIACSLQPYHQCFHRLAAANSFELAIQGFGGSVGIAVVVFVFVHMLNLGGLGGKLQRRLVEKGERDDSGFETCTSTDLENYRV